MLAAGFDPVVANTNCIVYPLCDAIVAYEAVPRNEPVMFVANNDPVISNLVVPGLKL